MGTSVQLLDGFYITRVQPVLMPVSIKNKNKNRKWNSDWLMERKKKWDESEKEKSKQDCVGVLSSGWRDLMLIK